jgi:signal transduction histidine kinase
VKILIAEDDGASRAILAQFLTRLGHDVVATADGQQALDVFRREDVPVLISDWMMPNLDGLGLCRQIRAEERANYTYVILLTVLGGKESYLEAMDAGADDFISKPFDVDQLHARLRVAERILGLQRELRHIELTHQQTVRQERLRALGMMASGVAHDFTNALSAIVGFSSMLLMRPADLNDTEKVRRRLELISTAGQDAAQLVRRLREFYRARDESEEFMPVDLNEVVTTAVSLTEPKWKAQTQALGHTIHVETTLPPIPLVDGNAAELRDVMTNLIFNATDAMPDGGVLTIRTAHDAGRGVVLLEVRDTGTGMTDDVRRRCLEPYFTTKGDRGTGLGLAMTYGIVQRHGGSIDLESEPGRGTVIAIHLPARTEQADAAPEARDDAVCRPLRVLVVEDEAIALEVLVECLTGDGHHVETATNGREGLQRFQAGWFDVVVTDRAMPEMNGIDLALNIKRIAPRKPVIIMLTGFGDEMALAAEKPPGVDYVIAKPITLGKLRDVLALVAS